MKAILLTLTRNNSEIRELLSTLGYEIDRTFYQNRNNPDNTFYIGKQPFSF